MIRALTLLVEAFLPSLLVRKDAEGDVLPTRLSRLDVSRPLVIVLPAGARFEGHLVREPDCEAIADAVSQDLRDRHRRNQRWSNLEALVLHAERARASDPQKYPVVRLTADLPDVPALEEPTARVTIGGIPYELGAGLDRREVPLGGARRLLLALDERVYLHPTGIEIHSDRGSFSTVVAVEPGERFRVVRRRWFGRSEVLAEGEVLWVHAAQRPTSGPMRWAVTGAGDPWLDVANPEAIAQDQNDVLHLRVDFERGAIQLSNRGARAMVGTGSLGTVRIERGFVAEALPGEVRFVQVGDTEIGLVADASAATREKQDIIVVPEAASPRHQNGRRFFPLRGWNGWTHLGELHRAAGTGWFEPKLPCRVDGREANLGELLPVRGVIHIQVASGSLQVPV